MQVILETVAVWTLTMSLVALAFLSLSPFVSKRYGAKWQYYAWLIIIIGFIIPIRPSLGFTLFDIPAIQELTSIEKAAQMKENHADNIWSSSSIENTEPVMPSIRTTKAIIPIYQIIGVIWIAGALFVIGYHIVRHYYFIRMVRRWSNGITNDDTLDLLGKTKSEFGVSEQIKLVCCELISSPMLIGFFKPVILLPSVRLSQIELTFIFRHELTHFKRKDIWYKCLTLAATALHWFNPVIYLVSRTIAEKCELSCDAEVVKDTDTQTRRRYSESILNAVAYQTKMRTAFSTNFYGGNNIMKNRINSILDITKKRTGVLVLCGVMVMTLMTGVVYAANAAVQPKDTITAEDSQKANNAASAQVTDESKMLSAGQTAVDTQKANTAQIADDSQKAANASTSNEPKNTSEVAPPKDSREFDPNSQEAKDSLAAMKANIKGNVDRYVSENIISRETGDSMYEYIVSNLYTQYSKEEARLSTYERLVVDGILIESEVTACQASDVSYLAGRSK